MISYTLEQLPFTENFYCNPTCLYFGDTREKLQSFIFEKLQNSDIKLGIKFTNFFISCKNCYYPTIYDECKSKISSRTYTSHQTPSNLYTSWKGLFFSYLVNKTLHTALRHPLTALTYSLMKFEFSFNDFSYVPLPPHFNIAMLATLRQTSSAFCIRVKTQIVLYNSKADIIQF